MTVMGMTEGTGAGAAMTEEKVLDPDLCSRLDALIPQVVVKTDK